MPKSAKAEEMPLKARTKAMTPSWAGASIRARAIVMKTGAARVTTFVVPEARRPRINLCSTA